MAAPNRAKPAEQPRRAGREAARQLSWSIPVVTLLLALGLFLYLPLFSSATIVDDGAVAFENPAVCGNAFVFSAPYYAGTFRPLWRPVATLSLHWNCLLAGSDKPYFELINLLLLAVCAFLTFLLLQRFGVGLALALFVALVLLLHPVVSESVLRIAGRSELLALPLLLAALLVYVRIASRSVPRKDEHAAPGDHAAPVGAWVAWGLLFLLGLLSRENVLVLPLLVVGYELTLGARSRRGSANAAGRRLAWAVGICIVVAVLWVVARADVLRAWPMGLCGNPAPDYLAALTTGERVQHALSLPSLYARMLCDPGAILPDYAHLLALPQDAPPVVLGDPTTFGISVPGIDAVLQGGVVLLAGFAVFVFARRRHPLAAFGGWIFGVALLAALPLWGSNGHVASARHLFLPLFGLLLMLVTLLRFLATRYLTANRRIGWGLGGLAVLLLLGLFVATRQVGATWRTGDAVVERLIERAPLSPEIPLQRAAAALRSGQRLRARGDHRAADIQLEAAATYYEEAISLYPRMPRALLNLGLIRAEQRQASFAGRALSDAAVVAQRVFPNSHLAARSYVALGTYYGHQGLDDRAMMAFQRAVEIDSTNVQGLARAGLLEAMYAGSARLGIEHMQRALELDPGGRTLGMLADQIREIVERAQNYLSLSEQDSTAYWEAMVGDRTEGGASDGTSHE